MCTQLHQSINFSGDVIYQIVTDRFFDGDFNNNPKGDLFSQDGKNLRKYLGGDWKGITKRIRDGYLTEMGITAIWISPPVENIYTVNDRYPVEGLTSYHGYWARDLKKPNPFFGGLNDFKELVQTAHEHNIKVIIDFVPNHSSPISEEDPTYMEDGCLYDNGKLLSSYSKDTKGYFNHYSYLDLRSPSEDMIYRNLHSLADFNQLSPDIDKYLKEAVLFWLELGIDGIRVDAVRHMPFGWLKTFVDHIYSNRPVFLFGEWFLIEKETKIKQIEYYEFANHSGMSLLDFYYCNKIRQVLRDKNDNWLSFSKMLQDTDLSYEQINDQVIFLDNHDMDRFTTDRRTTDMALVTLLTSRGVPCIYYGTEQYMTGNCNEDHENREMMKCFDRNTNAYQIIKRLSSLRGRNPALAYGITKVRKATKDLFIYERNYQGHIVLVAINSTDTPTSITRLSTDLPQGSYMDVLDGLLNGGEIEVMSDGMVQEFKLKPGASVWEFNNVNEKKPAIGHIGPRIGKPGQVITIDGDGFGFKPGIVQFNHIPAKIASWSNSRIQVIIPDLPPDRYRILVKTKKGVCQSDPQVEILSGDQVCVRFVVKNLKTAPNEQVYLMGNIYELGNMNPHRAIGPMFNKIIYQYPDWYYDVSVPVNKKIQFKFIIKGENGEIRIPDNLYLYTTPKNSTGEIVVRFEE